MAEVLTMQIAKEYTDRAKCLPPNGFQDTGQRRALRLELQSRCNLTELQAVNIVNGFHVKDYVVNEERKELERQRKEEDKSEN